MDNETVIGLRGHVPQVRKMNTEALGEIEDLAERIRNGEVTGFMAVVHYFDGATGIFHAGPTNWAVLGKLMELQRRALEALSKS